MCSVFLNKYSTAEKAVNNQNDVSKLPTSQAYGEGPSPEISVIYLHYSISEYSPSRMDSVKKVVDNKYIFHFIKCKITMKIMELFSADLHVAQCVCIKNKASYQKILYTIHTQTYIWHTI